MSERLPFDPSKMRARQEASTDVNRGGGGAPRREKSTTTDSDSPITVAQLASRIDRALREHVDSPVRVVGEIGGSGVRQRTHWYFDLKDEAAVISCVMFASAAAKAASAWGGGLPNAGDRVVATGRVEFFAKQGRTQFYVTRLQPVGEGALDAALRRLVEECRALGWLDPARKRRLPPFPRRIAVVTSRSGAALQDVLDTLRRRCTAVGVVLLDVRVQGEGSAAEVVHALRYVGQQHAEERLDAVLITRGGGSREDLWTFNERVVAEAIVNCPIPVVCAIGHETDTTLAELVADERCATPTQAAMRLSPDSSAIEEQLTQLVSRLHAAAKRHIRLDAERLRGLARRPIIQDPSLIVRDARKRLEDAERRLVSAQASLVRDAAHRLTVRSAALHRHRPENVYARRESSLREVTIGLHEAMRDRLEVDLDGLAARLTRAVRTMMEKQGGEVESAARGLDLVAPIGVLRRGFSCTLNADGTVVRSWRDVAPGQTVRTRVADGEFSSVVEGEGAAVPPPAGSQTKLAKPKAKRASRKSIDSNQPGLFGG